MSNTFIPNLSSEEKEIQETDVENKGICFIDLKVKVVPGYASLRLVSLLILYPCIEQTHPPVTGSTT